MFSLYSVSVLQLRPMGFILIWIYSNVISFLFAFSARAWAHYNGGGDDDDDGDDFINAAKWLLVCVFAYSYSHSANDAIKCNKVILAYVRAWHQRTQKMPYSLLSHSKHTHTHATHLFAMYFAPFALRPALIHISSMPSEKLLLSQLNGRFNNAVARVSVSHTSTHIQTQSLPHACVHLGVYLYVYADDCKAFLLYIQRMQGRRKSSRLLTGLNIVWPFNEYMHASLCRISIALYRNWIRAKQQAT